MRSLRDRVKRLGEWIVRIWIAVAILQGVFWLLVFGLIAWAAWTHRNDTSQTLPACSAVTKLTTSHRPKPPSEF